MATENTEAARVPAYVAFPTFLNFVDSYAGDDLPDHIDKSLMPTMAGGTQNHLMASLKSLNLIDGDGTATTEFKHLVRARPTPELFKSELRTLIDEAYEGIVETDGLSKLTPKKLQDSFRAAGATGSTTSRAIRFYLSALKACGVEVPKVLLKASSVGTVTRRKPDVSGGARPRTEPEDDDDDQRRRGGDTPQDDDGFSSFPVFLGPDRQGRIVFPVDLTDADCDKYEAAVKYLRVVAKISEI